MAEEFDRIDDRLRTFIAGQPMYFVASAPLEGGHVNISRALSRGRHRPGKRARPRVLPALGLSTLRRCGAVVVRTPMAFKKAGKSEAPRSSY
jgi:hypothetical protein